MKATSLRGAVSVRGLSIYGLGAGYYLPYSVLAPIFSGWCLTMHPCAPCRQTGVPINHWGACALTCTCVYANFLFPTNLYISLMFYLHAKISDFTTQNKHILPIAVIKSWQGFTPPWLATCSGTRNKKIKIKMYYLLPPITGSTQPKWHNYFLIIL